MNKIVKNIVTRWPKIKLLAEKLYIFNIHLNNLLHLIYPIHDTGTSGDTGGGYEGNIEVASGWWKMKWKMIL